MAHILVVDDNDMVRRIVGHILEISGHRVSAACNGYEALKALHEGPVDMVLTDLDMPGMDGEELLREVRRIRPTTPCAGMSGGGAGRGFDGFLQKPFEVNDLVRLVGGILERYREEPWLQPVGV